MLEGSVRDPPPLALMLSWSSSSRQLRFACTATFLLLASAAAVLAFLPVRFGQRVVNGGPGIGGPGMVRGLLGPMKSEVVVVMLDRPVARPACSVCLCILVGVWLVRLLPQASGRVLPVPLVAAAHCFVRAILGLVFGLPFVMSLAGPGRTEPVSQQEGSASCPGR